ncbi:MAG TPA: L,D-transpeptidase [Miltoncostaeaceae bacterium]|nr:L,D-transpeptidase [Miltoncostaeaceae bacterium]
MCAGLVMAALSLAPVAGAAPATAQERATPVLTARVVLPTTAYGAPRGGARRVMSLRGATAWTGSAQRLLVTGRHTDRAGRDWVRVQLPIRPNGSAGWVRADRVRLTGTHVRFEVHLGSRRLEIWRGGRLLHRFAAGIGRPGTPTPVGRFAIQDPVPTVPGWRSVYGAWTLTLTAHSNVLKRFMGGDGLVAIHGTGTGRGWRVGQPSSFGCVILGEPELAVAARYARAGTPVVIDRS